jgi:RHS repeat-associated protein
MPLSGRQLTPASGNYRYGFNGKELDDDGTGMGGGGNTYDYGFRIYNPQIAKFLSVDPLTKEYPWYTPYQFAGNKPIRFIDLDGKRSKCCWKI